MSFDVDPVSANRCTTDAMATVTALTAAMNATAVILFTSHLNLLTDFKNIWLSRLQYRLKARYAIRILTF